MTTVRSIVDELGLDLAAGAERAEEPVRWVHISEEDDPTPWLTGGELLLTSGFSLNTPTQQRSFLRRLAEHELAGLGFGLTERRQCTPKPLVDEARKLEFPLFEVPSSMSFIKVTKLALERLVSEQYDVLRRSVLVQQRLERMVLEDRGLEQIVAAISDAVGASVLVLGGPGQVLARHDPADVLSADTIAAIGVQTEARRDSQPFIRRAEVVPRPGS
jgi:purine catabolism regulator